MKIRGDNILSWMASSRSVYWYLAALVLVLMIWRQEKVTNFNCEICADKAGYYVYLPAVFYYGFQASAYPEGLDELHGNGFTLDQTSNRVVTKFTSGVALLLSPFYALGVLVSESLSLHEDPFSRFFLIFLNIGAVFYIISGLYFFKKWLEYYVDSKSAFLSMLLVFLGTHLFYYVLDENLMGHMYSFALFAASLYFSKSFFQQGRSRDFLFFSLAISLAILIRPTNALFVLIILFLDINRIGELKERLSKLLRPGIIFTGIFILLLVMLPQLLYWKYTFGRYLVWSYTGEGFYFWRHPWWMVTWFSPQSGLFVYTPVLLLALALSAWMIREKYPNGLVVILTFFAVSYMCASWSNPFFGECNFGKRPFVEFLPVLMLPFAVVFSSFNRFSLNIRRLLVVLISFFVVYNIALFVVFDTCFPGGAWDWQAYLGMLKKMVLLDKFGV